MHAIPCFIAVVLALSSEEAVTLQDGQEISARILALDESGLRLEGREEALGIYELKELRFGGRAPSGEEAEAKGLASGPIVRFRSGETARAVAAKVGEAAAEIELSLAEGRRVLEAPLECIAGFRLREARADDPLFEDDLRDGPPALRPRAAAREEPEPEGKGAPGLRETPVPTDTIYVVRPGGILRAEGRFRSLDGEYLTLTMEEGLRRVRRDIVFGAIFAPMASPAVETEIPAVIETEGAGRLPAFVRRIEGAPPHRTVSFRFPGARADSLQSISERSVRRILFSSDRVVFLSNLAPVRVEEVPALGDRVPFPWKKDLSSAGSPLFLGGRRYSKGLGVHPYCALEYELDGRFRALAGTIGLDDAAREGASVKFRVLADGKEIFAKTLAKGPSGKPGAFENLSLPLEGVRRLSLEVDTPTEGFELGAHADWADLRAAR